MANSSNLAFCLEYSNHKTDMMDAFDDYLRNESMVDVMLSCEGNTIKAHKMVLSAGSTYFRNIFAAFKNPFQFPVLIIKDMPFRDLKAIVEFLYRGEVVVPVEQVSSLSKSAQTLFIKGLEKYFNKSAVVNVANNSNNCSSNQSTTKTTPLSNNEDNSVHRTQTSANVSKLKAKRTSNQSNRSISMSLRKTRRPDYRQLSNGDFISDEDMSETEIQNRFNSPTVRKTGRRSSGLASRRIKSEIINENYGNKQQNSKNQTIFNNQDHNEDAERMSETDIAENYNSDEFIESEDDEQQIASTSKQTEDAIPFISKKVNTPFRQKLSSDATSETRPIKIDPVKMELIHCSLCPRVFSHNSSLSIHMKRVHSEDKAHICQLCGKKYSWRSGLYKHMRTHRDP